MPADQVGEVWGLQILFLGMASLQPGCGGVPAWGSPVLPFPSECQLGDSRIHRHPSATQFWLHLCCLVSPVLPGPCVQTPKRRKVEQNGKESQKLWPFSREGMLVCPPAHIGWVTVLNVHAVLTRPWCRNSEDCTAFPDVPLDVCASVSKSPAFSVPYLCT